MKKIIVIILERFADWEVALLVPVLQPFVKGYCVHYASVDKNERQNFHRQSSRYAGSHLT